LPFSVKYLNNFRISTTILWNC